MDNMQKRVVKVVKRSGMSISDIILVAVLLAAGAVLKFAVGTVVNIAGMKPNFIIAMYCLAILLIKPKLYECAIIGIIAGAVCQIFPGTPYLNFISELVGATAMGLLIKLPMTVKKFSLTPVVGTFVSTVLSGSTFVVCLFAFLHAAAASLTAFIPIVLFTAAFNAVIVQVLAIPLSMILKKMPGAEARA